MDSSRLALPRFRDIFFVPVITKQDSKLAKIILQLNPEH